MGGWGVGTGGEMPDFWAGRGKPPGRRDTTTEQPIWGVTIVTHSQPQEGVF